MTAKLVLGALYALGLAAFFVLCVLSALRSGQVYVPFTSGIARSGYLVRQAAPRAFWVVVWIYAAFAVMAALMVPYLVLAR